MTSEDRKSIGDVKNLRRLQGFYVYRNNRLIVPGTWFKLTESKELRNLARVRVDIPNTLDFLWDIDIKKSTAILPLQLRSAFVQFLDKVTTRSERVHQFRGRKKSDNIYVWERLETRDSYKYLLNRDHPLISRYYSKLDVDSKRDFEDIMNLVESSIPFTSIYADMGGGTVPSLSEDPDFNEKMYVVGLELLKQGMTLDAIAIIEPWVNHPDILSKMRNSI